MQGYLQNIRQYSFYARVRMSQSLRKDHLCVSVFSGKTLQGHTTRCECSFYLLWSHEPPTPIHSTSNMFLFYDRR